MSPSPVSPGEFDLVPVLEKLGLQEAMDRVEVAVADRGMDFRLSHGSVDFRCRPDDFPETMGILRDAGGIRCRFFTFLSAIDRSELGDGAGGLEVFAHVYSPEYVIHVTVHVPVDPEHPACPSITSVYAGAAWHERETHEMFGIDFPGHPKLVNLYLPEDFEGNPLRRSFKLPSRFVKEWPGAKDPEEAAGGGR